MIFRQLGYRFTVFRFTIFKILIGLTCLGYSLCWGMPVAVAVQEINFSGDRGYQVQTTFSYDETKNASEIAAQRKGATKVVDYLQVSFYDPAGKLIASYDNIVDNIVQGNYFEFHYDPIKQQLVGEIDLGGESPGEMYLKGNVDEELSLITVESPGSEKIIDRMLVVSR